MSVSGICNRVKSAGWGVCFGTEALLRGTGGLLVFNGVATAVRTVFDIYNNKQMSFTDFYSGHQQGLLIKKS